MLSASSPIAFPTSSSPPAPKRHAPHAQDRPRPNPRVNGPFVLDDDDSGEDSDTRNVEHMAKRRMLQHPGDTGPESTTASTETTASHSQQKSEAIKVGQRDTNDDPSPPISQPLLSVWSSQRPLFYGPFPGTIAPCSYASRSCAGKTITIKERRTNPAVSYESIVAARSKTNEGRAKRSYYGIEIHELINDAAKELASKQQSRESETSIPAQSTEPPVTAGKKPKRTLLWTEKYRARNFMDLCGDDGTNRMVLRWLKRWDSVVFPGAARPKPVAARRPGVKRQAEEEKPHRKILMLTGPPGLGKTTLAHVCAKQAGYEVLEINASDDRSRDVVKSRIRTSLGTESVKTITNIKDGKSPHKLARPVCVVVDEVDGVVSGSGASGEGGFVKALIDLVLVDQKNASAVTNPTADNNRKKRKGDDFRLMRPLILICNDVYHPSLRPLRQSNLAEVIHIGRPSMEAVVGRLKSVFEKEGIACEKDAARKLCEAAWGVTSGIDAKRGAESTVEGDLRGVMVVGEWVAGRFRSSSLSGSRMLTRQWIERDVLDDLASNAAGARGLGRGSVKDIVNRLFQEGGGFPKQAMDLSESKTKHEQPKSELGFGEQQKKQAMDRLTQMVNTSGEISNIMTEIFAEYPNREFNDDDYLTKPNQAYDWLHFHDTCQSRLYASQEWELAPYLGQPVLACHHLFASPKRHFGGFEKRWGAGPDAEEGNPPTPFSGPRADYQAREAEKQNRAQLQALQAQLSPSLVRSFRSAEDVATEFLPYLVRIVSPDVKPVVVGGSQGSMASVRKESERAMVRRASEVLADVGIALQRGKIESETLPGRGPQYVYRMDPDLDALSTFETGASLLASQAPTRYAVRQVLDQELQRTIALRETAARQARFRAGNPSHRPAPALPPTPLVSKEDAEAGAVIKRDFFGRVVEARPLSELDRNKEEKRARREERKVWVTFHEGLNNAVRKPISLQEFMRAL
ncbi:Chromosome transmission fidelity protein 18 [Tolypocladium capitatum]|uniref:Chromosome transmission fidelity protein 18 n=1 Tax=Tolypocladium capitatum TaxID=45235 RepID=A0A2K3Q926_9HYPO|nr:Chromosome transmission fidelity protein 18 [Tolypocladium capitatum]